MPPRVRKKVPESRAYVLRQTSDGKWSIVDRSGPSNLGEPGKTRALRHDQADDDAALESMRGEAERRQATAERFAREDAVILFVAVLAAELPQHGLEIPMVSV